MTNNDFRIPRIGERGSPEGKLAKQVVDALMDRRFQKVVFGGIIATSDPVVQREFIDLLANVVEMICINYDNGNFVGDDLPYLRIALSMRAVLAEHYADPEDINYDVLDEMNY